MSEWGPSSSGFKVHWWALLNTAMNLQFIQMAGNVLASSTNISISGRPLLHRVSEDKVKTYPSPWHWSYARARLCRFLRGKCNFRNQTLPLIWSRWFGSQTPDIRWNQTLLRAMGTAFHPCTCMRHKHCLILVLHLRGYIQTTKGTNKQTNEYKVRERNKPK